MLVLERSGKLNKTGAHKVRPLGRPGD